MQQSQQQRSSQGAKALTLNEKATIARYRLLLLISFILSAVFALSLHLIFAR